MSTRARVGVELKDGTILSMYVNSDGYIDQLGRILFNNYTDKKDIIKLIRSGNARRIGPTINQSTFFKEKPEISNDQYSFIEMSLKTGMDFIYLYVLDNEWLYSKRNETPYALEDLEYAISDNLEASTNPNDMDALISDEYDLEEDEEEDDEDDSEGMEWEAGELESEAGSVVIQAILELIDNQIEVLGYHFDEWMEEKKEEGYTNEDEMHDAIEWAYTRTRQAIENLSIQD